MKPWDTYPADYRQEECERITRAVKAGECVALVGLSGAGKSNLLGFLAQNMAAPRPVLVDCNRLSQPTPEALYCQVRRLSGSTDAAADEFTALETVLTQQLTPTSQGVCLIFDRFDVFMDRPHQAMFNNLRGLRDDHKYQLTLVISTRHSLPPDNELAELFYAHTLYLGPLSPGNARWSASSYAQRLGLVWEDPTLEKINALSGGYPAFIRAVCEAHAAGVPLEMEKLQTASAVKARLSEFMADHPTAQDLRLCGLTENPMLQDLLRGQDLQKPLETNLTVMEQRLLEALHTHTDQLCTKDDLIQAVWTEDRIFQQGVRDDSLAQLVRRLREKIESDPSNPKHILTAPGRGYIFHK